MCRFFLATFAGLLMASGIISTQERGAEVKSLKIASFESPEEIQRLRLTSVRVSQVQEHATDGRSALKVEFARGGRPGLYFPSGAKPWDWRQYGGLAFDLTNPSEEEIAFAIRIEDAPAADDPKHNVSGGSTIGPRLTVSYVYPLGASMPMEHGMRGGPPAPGVEPFIYFPYRRVNEGHITGFQFFLDHPAAAHTLILDNIRLLPPVSYEGIVDAFGQYTRADWPGKVKDEADLARRRTEEEARVQAAPTLSDRDEYGGWASGPQIQPTGFFATVKRDGKWWLATPSGHLFLSLGVDAMSLDEGPTIIEGREKMFTSLPAADSPLARHYGYAADVLYGPIKKGRTFNFYAANLERKYGPDYLAKWRAATLERLRAWGFNTIANWSDPGLYALKRVPYTATIDISGDYARVASGQDYWGKMHDPYDPKFAAAVDKNIRDTVQRYRDDPWCLGYFIDNEISWGSGDSDRTHFGLAHGTLAGGKDSPAKQAFVEQFKLHYGGIKRLNKAWDAKFSSWKMLLEQPYKPPGALTAQMRDDFSSFLKAFAQQYFHVISDTLKKYDPNHLYLGCRFAWRTPEAVAAAAEYCDVVSFNIYRSHVDAREWDFTKSLNKPCIIGEFHFGALDRGMFHTGLVSTPNQQARAKMYQDYLHSVIDNAAFVGCHWFEYVDEPLTGRTYDGENYNIGLVTATDTPYPEMVEAAKAVHAEVYARRAAKQ